MAQIGINTATPIGTFYINEGSSIVTEIVGEGTGNIEIGVLRFSAEKLNLKENLQIINGG